MIGDPSGTNLRGKFITPDEVKITSPANLSAQGGEDSFVVFPIQNGAAPAIQVEGSGLKAKVSIGDQTVTFDGERLVFGR